MDPRRVDAIVDLVYGVLIFVSIVSIVLVELQVGLAFGLGVLISYAVHVVWKMARFDPEWMTRTVEQTVQQTVGEQVEQVEETVGKQVEETVEQTVGEQVEETVEQTVGEQVDAVQQQIETVDERIDRRPREDELEELLEDTVADESDESSER